MKYYIRFSNLATISIYCITGIILTVLSIHFLFDYKKGYYYFYIVSLLLALMIGTFILQKIAHLSLKTNESSLFIGLLIICFLIKFAWVWFYRIEPVGDYATFYYTTVELSEHEMIQKRYIALFPHIFGYSSFLSIFMKIFGPSYILPPGAVRKVNF